MRSRQTKVRGSNKISGLLNKPIDGNLSETKSSLFTISVLIIAFLVLLGFATSMLGFKDGLVIILVIGFLGVVAYARVKSQNEAAKKYHWKVFDDDK